MRTIIIYKFDDRSKASVVFTRAVGVCLLVVASAAGAQPADHRYVVRVDAEFQRMQVEAQFDHPVRSIRARSRDARRFIANAYDCDNERPLAHRDRRLMLPRDGTRCIRYDVNLERAARAERRNATLAAANIVVSPAVWFWRPQITADRRVSVTFELDDSVQVSVPWQKIPGQANSYWPMPSPESSTAPAAFGDFEYHEVDVPGATLRITLLSSDTRIDSMDIVEWIRSTAENVTLTYGKFPNPSPSIVVIPVGASRWSDSPVPFGRVVRDGGETIEFFINERMPIEAYYDDWTGTHEFSHLLLPYVRSRHRWISEGFAQYYQNLLLARAGEYSEQRAWQKLYEGFERGRNSGADMSPNEAAVGDRRAVTMKIYWTGAAVALLADVELRRRSNGRQSLDSVLRELQDCCLPAENAWSGTQLFAKLDSFLDAPLFMPLYEQHADTEGFPDTSEVLEQLGVSVENGAIRLDQGAPLAALRRAMTEG